MFSQIQGFLALREQLWEVPSVHSAEPPTPNPPEFHILHPFSFPHGKKYSLKSRNLLPDLHPNPYFTFPWEHKAPRAPFPPRPADIPSLPSLAFHGIAEF